MTREINEHVVLPAMQREAAQNQGVGKIINLVETYPHRRVHTSMYYILKKADPGL